MKMGTISDCIIYKQLSIQKKEMAEKMSEQNRQNLVLTSVKQYVLFS